MPGGRRPKLNGSPNTLARREEAAHKKKDQRARKNAGTSWRSGRPRKADDDGTPKRIAKRLAWRASHIQHEQKNATGLSLQQMACTSPTRAPPPAGSGQAHPSRSTRSRRCFICLDEYHDVDNSLPGFMPCCHKPVHRKCLASNMNQDPSKSSNGRIITGPSNDPGRMKPIPLETTHLCPRCKAPISSTRCLLPEGHKQPRQLQL